MSDTEFVAAFEACTIPFPSEWTHRAHLRVAYFYLTHHSLDDAIAKMRTGIRRFNAANGVVDTIDRGYHETLTQMWLRVIHGLLTTAGPESGFDAFVEMHPYLLQKMLGRLFYSRARIMTERAKHEYVPPDRTGFPGTVREA